jgi:hypothetical protein
VDRRRRPRLSCPPLQLHSDALEQFEVAVVLGAELELDLDLEVRLGETVATRISYA